MFLCKEVSFKALLSPAPYMNLRIKIYTLGDET